MRYGIATKQRVMSFDFDHWKYSLVDDIPTFKSKIVAEQKAKIMNEREKRVVNDRFDWYYAVIEVNGVKE